LFFEVATQVKADGVHTLELKMIFVLQQVSDSFWVLGRYRNVLVDIAIMLHPNVGLCLAWLETHVIGDPQSANHSCQQRPKVLRP